MDNVELRTQIIQSVRSVFDPEIPINVWDLGLIYELNVSDDVVVITMTLTSAFCPSAEQIPQDILNAVDQALKNCDVARDVQIDVVFDPPWSVDRITEEARLEMGMYSK